MKTTSREPPSKSFEDQRRSLSTAADDIGREAWAMRNSAAFLAPGYVLLPELSSQGGTKSEDYVTEVDKKSKKQRVSYLKTVDHPTLDQSALQTIASARYILDTHTARFVSGTYFVQTDAFEKIDHELDQARKDAEVCNKVARELGSARQTVIEVYKFELDVNDRRIAVRLGATICKRLQILRDSFTSKARRGFQTAWTACTNMDQLVGGTQREILRLALQSAQSQRPLMIAHYGGRKGVGEVRREFGGRIPDFDFGPIDTALQLFTPQVARKS